MSSCSTPIAFTNNDSDASFEDTDSDTPALCPTTFGSYRLSAGAQDIMNDALNFLDGGGELEEKLCAPAHTCPAGTQAASSRAVSSGKGTQAASSRAVSSGKTQHVMRQPAYLLAGAIGWRNAQAQTGLAAGVPETPVPNVGSSAFGVPQMSYGPAQHVFGWTQASWGENPAANQASVDPFPQAFEAPVTQQPYIRKREILTVEAVIQIFLASRSPKQRGLTSRLAKLYRVTPKAVRDIWTLRTWRAVTEPMWSDAERQLAQR
jgi:hypothetical protein